MSIAQQRLDAYLAAEARILNAGFSVQLGERRRQEAELERIQIAIKELEARVAQESGTARGSLSYRSVVFNR